MSRWARGDFNLAANRFDVAGKKLPVDHLRSPRRCISKWASCEDQTAFSDRYELSGPLQADPVLGVRQMPVDWALRLLIRRVFPTFRV